MLQVEDFSIRQFSGGRPESGYQIRTMETQTILPPPLLVFNGGGNRIVIQLVWKTCQGKDPLRRFLAHDGDLGLDPKSRCERPRHKFASPTLMPIRRIASIMSLLHLVHKNVIIKFADAARNQFDPEASHVFRLAGVDAMGFLQIQDLKPGGHAGHETVSEPYWINKDLVREIHELDLAKVKELTPKPDKAKSPRKQKAVLN